MRIQIWHNKAKGTKNDPDYLVLQRQRTGADDGSGAYETVQIGVGFKNEAPDGETYISATVDGFSDMKPRKTKQ